MFPFTNMSQTWYKNVPKVNTLKCIDSKIYDPFFTIHLNFKLHISLLILYPSNRASSYLQRNTLTVITSALDAAIKQKA